MGKSIRSKVKKHNRTVKREAWAPIFDKKDEERAKVMAAAIDAQRNTLTTGQKEALVTAAYDAEAKGLPPVCTVRCRRCCCSCSCGSQSLY